MIMGWAWGTCDIMLVSFKGIVCVKDKVSDAKVIMRKCYMFITNKLVPATAL